MTENERRLYEALERIVSYYDAIERGYRGPSMDDQAKSMHENTMFGEARKVLKETINRERTVMSTEGNGLQAAMIPESGRSTDRGTAD